MLPSKRIRKSKASKARTAKETRKSLPTCPLPSLAKGYVIVVENDVTLSRSVDRSLLWTRKIGILPRTKR